MRATGQFGWSRNVLLNQIKASAYARAVTEKKAHNFPLAIPEYLAEQAVEMLKSSYNLEFLGLKRAVKERDRINELQGHEAGNEETVAHSATPLASPFTGVLGAACFRTC